MKDRRRAFELYNEAATAGNRDAWLNIASMYNKGDGVPKDPRTSREIMRVMFDVIIP
jgi:TPR repeat protein